MVPCSVFSVATALALFPRTLGGLRLLILFFVPLCLGAFPFAHSISTKHTLIIPILVPSDTGDLVELSW